VTEKLLIVLGITTLCMLSPGPDMVLVMRNTLTGDRRRGGLTALGILTGNLIHIAYCAVGIALLLSRSPLAYNVLRIAGAIYLVYLGVQGIRNAGGRGPEVVAATDATRANPYAQGFVSNLLNPKGSLFYLGVFTQVITPDMSLAQTGLLVVAMMSVSVMFWMAFVQILHLPAIRAALQNSKGTMERVFGVVLIALGARIATLK
jgi:threonine/homoserine/homoserine lactone efflux protein